jgi:hypothetical protein
MKLLFLSNNPNLINETIIIRITAEFVDGSLNKDAVVNILIVENNYYT